MKLLFPLLLFIITNIQPTIAQSDKLFNNSQQKVGLMVGYGGQSLQHILDDLESDKSENLNDFFLDIGINPEGKLWNLSYTYQTYFFKLQYYFALKRNEKWGYELLAQPQINLMQFRFEDDSINETTGLEFGCNFGFLIRRNFSNDRFSIYASLSVGPHYITHAPLRQSQGYIFSDNLFVGANIQLANKIYLDIRPGFRHISNAGLLPLNGGINSLILSGGLMLVL